MRIVTTCRDIVTYAIYNDYGFRLHCSHKTGRSATARSCPQVNQFVSKETCLDCGRCGHHAAGLEECYYGQAGAKTKPKVADLRAKLTNSSDAIGLVPSIEFGTLIGKGTKVQTLNGFAGTILSWLFVGWPGNTTPNQKVRRKF